MKKPLSVIIGLVILVIGAIGYVFNLISQGLSLSSLLLVLFSLCLIVGFWKRSNIARIGYFIFMNLGLVAVIIPVFAGAMRQSPGKIILALIPFLLLISNSWFVLFGRKSKAYFAKAAEVQTTEG